MMAANLAANVMQSSAPDKRQLQPSLSTKEYAIDVEKDRLDFMLIKLVSTIGEYDERWRGVPWVC
jgi:hypothetical protein